jgi:hypothetical protein
LKHVVSFDILIKETNLKIKTLLNVIIVISGAKDEGYNLKYNNKRIDSKWNQLS